MSLVIGDKPFRHGRPPFDPAEPKSLSILQYWQWLPRGVAADWLSLRLASLVERHQIHAVLEPPAMAARAWGVGSAEAGLIAFSFLHGVDQMHVGHATRLHSKPNGVVTSSMWFNHDRNPASG